MPAKHPWLRRPVPRPSAGTVADLLDRRPRFRPRLLVLEDRVLPSHGLTDLLPTSYTPVSAVGPAAVHFTTLADLPAGAQQAVSLAIGRDQSSYHAATTGGAVTLANPANAFTAQLQAGALQVSSGADSWSMVLAGFGYGGMVQPVGTAQTTANGNRVDITYGPIDEWYVNGPSGLEQGFNVTPQSSVEPLTIELSLGGDLKGTVTPAGTAITLARPNGSAALAYAGLNAYDSSGKKLAASMEVQTVSGRQVLWIHVDDAGAKGTITIDPLVQETELTAPDGAANSGLGAAVAVSGNTLVVSAAGTALQNGQGAVYVFSASGSSWNQTAELTAGTARDNFGSAVAISGNTIVIGADGTGNYRGAAYVFTQSGSAWSQTAQLTAPDGAANDDFGNSVAISGDTIVVGAMNATARLWGLPGPGAAYIFTGSGSDWSPGTKLTASDGTGFGSSVSVSGTTIVVGADSTTVGTNSGQGAAYLFAASGAAWVQTAELTASDGTGFGSSVSISGTTIVVGADSTTVGTNSGQGAAYVFTASGAAWSQTAKLTASDGTSDAEFGVSVAISGGTIVVGEAPFNSGHQRTAYVFTGSGAAWTALPDLSAPFYVTPTPGQPSDGFGSAVAISNNTVVVGAPGTTVGAHSGQGATYVFGTPTLLTGLSTASGPLTGGAPVTITGSGFLGATQVDFGPTPATNVVIDSNTQITATSPPGTGTVNVIVEKPGASSPVNSVDPYTYLPAPEVTALGAAIGPAAGGTTVTITGTGFTGATQVNFGSMAATYVVVDSPTQITATSPAGGGTVDVTVTTAGGTTAVSSADQFTYSVVPAVVSVSPSSGPPAGGSSVTITGTGFAGSTLVLFGSTPATNVTIVSPTQITATSPAGTGTEDLTVINSGGFSAVSPGDQFVYATGPVVTGVGPATGPAVGGSTVTVTGSAFTNATQVYFGATPASSFVVNSDTQITATSPAGVNTVNVTVVTSAGTSAVSSADQFSYGNAPSVIGITPSQGSLAGGMPVDIYGSNLISPVSFVALNDPAGVLGTYVTGVSGSSVVGDYLDSSGVSHGFIYNGSSFATMDVPGVTNGTYVTGVSDGTEVGYYRNTAVRPATSVGFLYNGSFTYPPALSGSDGIHANGIDGSTIIGDYNIGTPTHFTTHGFVYSGSSLTTLDDPASANDTSLNGISGGTIVGSYRDSSGLGHGFVYNGSAFSTLDDPAGVNGTYPVGVSGSTIVGCYQDASGTYHGFVYGGSGFIALDNPAAVEGTYLTGVSGDSVVGYYLDSNGVPNGFMANIPAASVTFGTAAATIVSASPTQIVASSPAGTAGAVTVNVFTSNGTSGDTPSDEFTYVATPIVTGVSPSNGPIGGGAAVTITGGGFSGATQVYFGATPASSFVVNSDTQITATSPAGVNTVNVTVVTSAGTSDISPADQFTYLVPLAVTGVSVGSGPAAGGTTVTIRGTGLTGATQVDFGSAPADYFVVNSDTQITAVSPAGPAGAVDVTVVTPNGASSLSSADQFSYLAAPVVNTISVADGPVTGNTALIITGGGFSGASLVEFGTASASQIVINSDSQITAISPAAAPGIVDVTVVTPTGTSDISLADEFTYLPPPTVTGVSPPGARSAGGTTVMITGTGFTAATQVYFGQAAAEHFVVNSATQITAVTPPGSVGYVDVTVDAPGGTSAVSSADRLKYAAAPAVIELTPSGGAASAYFGDAVSISGNTMVVGADGVNNYQGAAYVFTKSASGWTQTATLAITGGATRSYFGDSVSVSGDTIVVGARGANNSQGAVYVFTVSGSTWVQAAALAPTDTGEDDFGVSVSISGTTLVVGADYEDYSTGVAYIFTGSGSTWSNTATLTAADGSFFGESVAIRGTTVVVGADAPGLDDHGTAFVFTASSSTWNQVAELAAPNPSAGDGFGGSVAINGSTIVVGAPLATVNGTVGLGAAFVFTNSGSAWVDTARLTASDAALGGTNGDEFPDFGAAVSISGGTIVVGAFDANYDTIVNTGSAYVYTESGSSWIPSTELAAPSGESGDEFGGSVSIDGDTFVVGATGTDGGQGAVYVGPWTQAKICGLSPTLGPAAGGTTVTITGTGFTGATQVDFGTTPATNVVIDSDTQITATSPPGAGTENVSVETPGGVSALTIGTRFTYIPVPAITGLSVADGLLTGGATVTITGTNIASASDVLFGATAGTIVSNTNNQIIAVSPAGC